MAISKTLTPIPEPLQVDVIQDGVGLVQIRELFVQYQKSLGVDLSFQGFEEELRTLPGRYALPAGRLYLGTVAHAPAACVGLRPLAGDVCEIKRLFVRPRFRARGFARILMARVIGEARALGYTQMVLDTLPQMGPAQGLYHALGFSDIDAYTDNPIPGARFMRLWLSPPIAP